MLAAIQSHLEAALKPLGWAAIDVAEDIDAMGDMAGRIADRSAIIMPWRESAEPQELATGSFRQRVEVQFAVGIVVRSQAHHLGADRALRFDQLKIEAEAALAGWEPPGCIEPCELIGGESSPIERGVSIFVQTWATARFLTGA